MKISIECEAEDNQFNRNVTIECRDDVAIFSFSNILLIKKVINGINIITRFYYLYFVIQI